MGPYGVGRLTKTKAANLQTYYGRALRLNVGNVEATKFYVEGGIDASHENAGLVAHQ